MREQPAARNSAFYACVKHLAEDTRATPSTITTRRSRLAKTLRHALNLRRAQNQTLDQMRYAGADADFGPESGVSKSVRRLQTLASRHDDLRARRLKFSRGHAKRSSWTVLDKRDGRNYGAFSRPTLDTALRPANPKTYGKGDLADQFKNDHMTRKKPVSEAVDPEDRNLRMSKLRKAHSLAIKAHQLAGVVQSKQHKSQDVVKTNHSRSGEYYAKALRVKAMLQKHALPAGDKRTEADYEVRRLRHFHRMHTADKHDSLKASRLQRMSWRQPVLPKVDQEARQIRVSALRKALKRSEGAEKLISKAANVSPKIKSYQANKTTRLQLAIGAYAPGANPAAKAKLSSFKYAHRSLRGGLPKKPDTLQATRGYDIYGKTANSKQNARGKIDNIVAFIPKKSKVDRETRTARLKAILRSADAHEKASNDWIKRTTTPGAASKHMRKYPGLDGTMHSPSARLPAPPTALYHDIERERRHLAVAKFISNKAVRKSLLNNRVRLRKGLASLKKSKDTWQQYEWPLHKQGFNKYRQPE